jgi:Carboxypeptidase regulatory-like domain
MTRTSLVFLLLMFAACSTSRFVPMLPGRGCVAASGGAIAGGGSLAGTVTANGKPLPGAVVRLWHANSDLVLEKTSDASGNFLFTCVGPEWYSVAVVSPTRTWPIDVQVKEGQETRVTLRR